MCFVCLVCVCVTRPLTPHPTAPTYTTATLSAPLRSTLPTTRSPVHAPARSPQGSLSSGQLIRQQAAKEVNSGMERSESASARSRNSKRSNPASTRSGSIKGSEPQLVLPRVGKQPHQNIWDNRWVPPPPEVVVFVMGPPGSGKRCQCELLARNRAFGHVSLEQLIHVERIRGSPLGRRLSRLVSFGPGLPPSNTHLAHNPTPWEEPLHRARKGRCQLPAGNDLTN